MEEKYKFEFLNEALHTGIKTKDFGNVKVGMKIYQKDGMFDGKLTALKPGYEEARGTIEISGCESLEDCQVLLDAKLQDVMQAEAESPAAAKKVYEEFERQQKSEFEKQERARDKKISEKKSCLKRDKESIWDRQ